MFGGGVAKQVGVFGFGYNRANYKFDQGQRWGRFTTGRQMEIKRTSMFREDVTDLASVSASKLKIYAPILTMSLGYCLTIFVEARSGLKFPAPPTFASGLYLQCLGIAFGFMTLSTWLCFHAAQRAQVAMVQLRTRRVRVPVPTQRQLDSARRILSTYEEQSVYDMFRLPFVMPNSGNTPPGSDEEGKPKKAKEADKAGYSKGGLPGMAAKMKGKVKDIKDEAGGSKKEIAHAARIPGTTAGAPSWISKELDAREELPGASPSAHGLDAPSEPYEHFELVREAQKEYWCAEAYCRVTFLIGFMHMIQSFAYWLTLHNIAELGMVWNAMVCGITLSAGVWVMFRLDVLPDHGGCFPIEAAGPSVSCMSLALAYSHSPSQSVIDISRAVAILCYLMHLAWTFRLYMVAQPANSMANHQAKETGGRLFNQSASCETPTWLPAAFQHVSYLVAPPKTKAQLAQEQSDREHSKASDDPMVKIDMTPWYYTRTLLGFTFLGWLILLTGRIVECTMSERMLVTNPGAPPWTRIGQWYGWESGPISSKHYAHVTPQRGHFAWQRGWGPQGQQELWASDMFGFHPEADMHWAEPEGPEPLIGVAGKGENTWAEGVINYGRRWEGGHDWLDSGGHRRLRSIVPGFVRPVVPAAVQWPALLEPKFLACGSQGQVAALGAGGMGAFIPAEVVNGEASGHAASFSLDGLLELGMARGLNWASDRLLVNTGSGSIAACSAPTDRSLCSDLGLPKLPSYADGKVLAVIEAKEDQPFRAAVALGSQILMHQLVNSAWHVTAEVLLPFSVEGQGESHEIIHLVADHGKLLVTTSEGSVFQWRMQDGQAIAEAEREAPAAGPRRQWHAACALPTGKVARLASKRRGAGEWQPELLI
eukprot:CAMPEP_0197625272 /NCGR_PEP_ID=MMETSP1338-20131121/4680_1 /TAXON_ID=43686 ORGANISM="Pelagodinium beii, Strain RCC1491" /NCGR_SAMPLE_ID=MMETSP1338 /ASSEMBLY_ACC=CAM_ASM_000754 /LENGTH=877 /DNA_ID=CAMNT_0043195631 /DNA_START=22 /DNA_END=2655 /DNA_ORIENTATION=+